MSDTAHQEKHFESYIVTKLKAQGWKVGDTLKYDTERALYPDDLIAWLESTQPEKWAKLQKDNSERPRGADGSAVQGLGTARYHARHPQRILERSPVGCSVFNISSNQRWFANR